MNKPQKYSVEILSVCQTDEQATLAVFRNDKNPPGLQVTSEQVLLWCVARRSDGTTSIEGVIRRDGKMIAASSVAHFLRYATFAASRNVMADDDRARREAAEAHLRELKAAREQEQAERAAAAKAVSQEVMTPAVRLDVECNYCGWTGKVVENAGETPCPACDKKLTAAVAA